MTRYIKELLPWGKVADKIFAGATVKDFGEISSRKLPFGGNLVRSALLATKGNKTKLYIKETGTTWFSAEVRYFDFNEDQMKKLAAILDEANALVDKDKRISELQNEIGELSNEIASLKSLLKAKE